VANAPRSIRIELETSIFVVSRYRYVRNTCWGKECYQKVCVTRKGSVEKPLRLAQDTWKTEKRGRDGTSIYPRWHGKEDAISVLGISGSI